MLKLREKGLNENEIEFQQETKQEMEEYFDALVKEFEQDCNYIIYDLGVQATYVVVLRIQKRKPIYDFNENNQQMVAYEKSVNEYFIEYKEGKEPEVSAKVNEWDFLECERLNRRILLEKKGNID
jgi:hypothetical protein